MTNKQFSFEHWDLIIQNKIAQLTLTRPEKQNRIGRLTLEELAGITNILESNEDVWVVVLRGEGDDFSAGADVSMIGAMTDQKDNQYEESLKASQIILDKFEALNKPTIAVLKGNVIGAGVIIALCCDFRIALDNIRVSLPEVKRSIGVIMGTQRITRTIGIAHTKELIMLGRQIDACRALEIGLVGEVLTKDELEDRITELVNEILTLPPLAVALCKRIINEGQFLPRAGQDLEIILQKEVLGSQDFKEAISSFFEKRKPIYKGK